MANLDALDLLDFGLFPDGQIELGTLDGVRGLVLNGNDFLGRSGGSVHSAGDVDGDGFDDLIIGATGVDQIGGQLAGESYLVFGGNFSGSVTHQGDSLANLLTGTTSVDVIVAGEGSDELVGGGGADVLRGGQGDDILAVSDLAFQRLAGGNGLDTLRLDAANVVLDLTAIPDNRITGIESIDMTGLNANTLVLDRLEVLNLSDSSNTLVVQGDADDTVVLDAGWSVAPSELIDGKLFQVLEQGAATVKIAASVQLQASVTLPTDGGVFTVAVADNGQGVVVKQNGVELTTGDSFFDVFVITGSTNDDTLIVNFDQGNPIPSGGLIFDGGAQTNGDTLGFSGQLATGPFSLVDYVATGPNDGQVVFNATSAVSYFGLEPIIDNTSAVNRTFSIAASGDYQIALQDDVTQSGRSLISSAGGPGFESVSFQNPTGTLLINSGSGNDVINVSGLDALFSAGLEINGQTGNDSINVSGAHVSVTVIGGDGNESIIGSNQADSISGGAGNDSVDAGNGDDIVSGGADNDSLDGGGNDDSVSGDAGNDSIDGGSGNDELDGGSGADELSGGFGDDVLLGGTENDLLQGGAGSDSLGGEAGNDSLRGDSGSDELYGGDGDDDLEGGADADSLDGENGADALDGGSGNDYLFGGQDAGNDSIEGGTGDDVLDGADGNDSLVGGDGQDVINGGNGDDTGLGSGGDDSITGGAGSDSLVGQDGNDTVDGQTGNDSVLGGPGDDLLFGREGDDFLESEGGADIFFGGPGNDLINGGGDNDQLFGEEGDDILNGEAGNDELDGGEGDDIINGGADDDRLIGGGGNDTFDGQGGHDTVVDRSAGDGVSGPFVNVSLRLVSVPTPTDANGEFTTLADEVPYVDEWDDVVAELTADTLADTTTAVGTFRVDVPFDAALFEAVSIEYGPSFTESQQGEIDNENGRITGLSARTTRSDAGRVSFVILARVLFRVRSDVNLANDLVGTYILPTPDDDFTTEQLATDAPDGTGALSDLAGPTATNIWPVMYDLDDNGVVSFGDVAFFAGLFGNTVATLDTAFRADFDRNGTVSFGDVVFFAQNFGRARGTVSQQTYADNFPEAWEPAALLAADDIPAVTGDAQTEHRTLPPTHLQIEALRATAIGRFADAGVSAAELESLDSIEIRTEDLPAGYLGIATDDAIIIDIDASGVGWFIDESRTSNIDSTRQQHSAVARGRFDLLTVIAHELGHHAGLEHDDASFMRDQLNPGERRLPERTAIDDQFATIAGLDELFGL